MRAQHRFWITMLILALALAGCKGATDKEYDVKGKVVAVNPDKPSVTLDHEDIPGLMNAMTMEFDVPDRKLLEGIKAWWSWPLVDLKQQLTPPTPPATPSPPSDRACRTLR